MPVTREQVRAALAGRDPTILRAVLDAADVACPAQATAEVLAEKVVDALWWRTHSPVGELVMPDTLDTIVDRVARRLGLELVQGDAWARLDALATRLLPADRPISVGDLSPQDRARLRRAAWSELAGAGSSATAFGARWAARWAIGLMRGPIWDLLLLLPRVGPVLGTIRGATGAVAALSGPVGIALALLTLNHALGPRYDRALPLLVGVGLAVRNPVVVVWRSGAGPSAPHVDVHEGRPRVV